MYYSILYIKTLILQVPGTKLLESGLDTAAKSVHQEMNEILVGILIGVLVLAGITIRYLIKEKDKAVTAVREDYAKEQAINEGAHQQIIHAKDGQIQSLRDDGKELRNKYLKIAEDNTEVYKHLALKIGSFVEGQAVLSGQLEKIKSEITVEILKLYKHNS